jgi:hypothetical protein
MWQFGDNALGGGADTPQRNAVMMTRSDVNPFQGSLLLVYFNWSA